MPWPRCTTSLTWANKVSAQELSAWRPRASSAGYYWACSQRALFDRAVAEGRLPAELRKDSGPKPNAALGTCIHFHLQSGMRAKFPGPPKDFAPTEEEYATAASLFGGSRSALDSAIEASARLALAQVPKLPEGVFWRAEPTVDGGPLCPPGHIDLVASDNSIVVDLKTTRVKTTRLKRGALVQLAAYCKGAGATKARAIYVDSMSASWCTPFDVDFTGESALVMEQLERLVAFWRGPLLEDLAYPGLLDDTCGNDFCPYTAICRDVLAPKAEAQYNRKSRPELDLGGMSL